MQKLLLVGCGGFIGSVARYWLAGWVQERVGAGFPAGTLTVNVVGSLFIGLLLALSLERGALGLNSRLLLGVGVLGGFTTMSTFSFETISLLREGSITLALLNVTCTLVGCVLATWAGMQAGRWI